jgi:hypothetical protein
MRLFIGHFASNPSKLQQVFPPFSLLLEPKKWNLYMSEMETAGFSFNLSIDIRYHFFLLIGDLCVFEASLQSTLSNIAISGSQQSNPPTGPRILLDLRLTGEIGAQPTLFPRSIAQHERHAPDDREIMVVLMKSRQSLHNTQLYW